MTREQLERCWSAVARGAVDLDVMVDAVDVAIDAITDAGSRARVEAAMRPLRERIAATAEFAHQLGAVAPSRAKPTPTEAESFARRMLVTSISRIESTKDLGVLALETRDLVRQVQAGNLDGALAKRALINAATVAGLAIDDVERVLASSRAA